MALPAFVESRLDVGYDYGAVGGPEYATEIIEFGAGVEQRIALWSAAGGAWEIGARNITEAKKDYLLAFFRARHGSAVGFRFKDWNDWRADGEALAPDGTPTVQLVKTYSDGGQSVERTIKKPVSGTVTMTRGGNTFAGFSVDTTTGIATLTPDASATITDITQASPAVVTTSTAHGYSTGDTIWITGVEGMTSVNDQAYVITVVDSTSFELDGTDTTGAGAYTQNGTAEKYVQPGESLTWSGEFDVPARFDSDAFRAEFLAYDGDTGEGIYHLESLPVVEDKAV